MTDESSPNAFERDKPGTSARSDAEGAIEELRQRGGEFVDAVRATRMPMVLTDPNLPGNPIVFANESLLKLSGYSMSEVLGQQPHFMNGPDTDPKDAARFQEAIRSDQDDIIETVQYRKDGRRFVATVLISAFKNERGRTLNHFMSWLDVTRRVEAEDEVAELKAAQSALRESDARHRLLIDSWAQAVWETDPGGVVVRDSPSWRAYTGQTLEEWLGYGWLDAIHPDDRAYAERQWREAIAARGLVNAEFRMRAPDGGWRWTNVRAAPILDQQGAIEKWAGMNIDIDARKRAEEALRESEVKFRTVVETMVEACCLFEMIYDESGRPVDWRILEANDAYEKQSGLKDVVGKLASEFMPGTEPYWIEAFDQVVESGQAQRIEDWHQPTERWIHSSTARVGGPGSKRLVSVFYDVTERKRAEIAMCESERHSSVLLAELQHRVRNTLAVVRSIARRTAETTTSAEEMLAHFQGRLDAFSRVQAALTRNPDARISLTSLIEDELVAHAARDGEQIRIEGPAIELEPWTAERFSFAIHELATNAVKHGALMGDNGRIHIRWTKEAHGGGDELRLSWTESGVEVDDKKLEREGFGMEMLRRSLPYDLQAKTEVELRADGLHFEMSMPLTKRHASAGR